MWLRYSGVVLHRVAGLFACHPEYCRLLHRLIGVDHINLYKRFVDIGVSGGTGCWTEPKAGRASPKRKKGGITKNWPESGVGRPEATVGFYKRSEG